MGSSYKFGVIPQKITFGCGIMDKNLAGGVHCKGITELVGESGTDKTQLALQLLLTSQLPVGSGGLDGNAIYLHTEYPFQLRRLHQLAQNMPNLPSNAMDRIFINPLYNVDHLLDILLRLDFFIKSNNIKLLIVDSFAALFRGVFANTKDDYVTRKSYFYKIGAILNMFSRNYSMAVVVTNQVADVIRNFGTYNGRIQSFITSGREVQPALGLCWESCVKTRISLIKEEEHIFESENDVRTKRKMQIVFSINSKYGCCEFTISKQRVAAVENN